MAAMLLLIKQGCMKIKLIFGKRKSVLVIAH